MSSNPIELPPLPASLKSITGILKTATDLEKHDPAVAYWTRFHACQVALGIDKSSPESKGFLTKLMFWLEKEKTLRKGEEAFSNELVAHAHIENYAMKLFEKADNDDRTGRAGKNTIKIYFTSSQLFDTLAVFGEPSEEVVQKSKYAKWRAAYISKCLKNNETPLPPQESDGSEEEASLPSLEAKPLNPTIATNNLPDTGSTSSSSIPSSGPGNMYPNQPFYPSQSPLDPFSPSPQIPPKLPSVPPRATRPLDGNIAPTKITSPIPPSVSSSTGGTVALNGAFLDAEALMKAQKYCKYAGSALQYEDISTAVQNLELALSLLKTGQS
ncbi:vesicle trafficking 1 [Brevipalpus obovatus]|uniref:vesicle trafficking 1 n=1 Tax=Brevipalpus obovatus TaxID=246614 RepID=UPI003D9E9102